MPEKFSEKPADEPLEEADFGLKDEVDFWGLSHKVDQGIETLSQEERDRFEK